MSARLGLRVCTAIGVAVMVALSPCAMAQHAEHEQHAQPAYPAERADHAEHVHEAVDADYADHADQADSADSADHADHSGHSGHSAKGRPRTPIPSVTDADRAAAFPPALHGHESHDRRIHSYWLVDRLEWQDVPGGGAGWEGHAWIGGDIDRVWLRTEGEAVDGDAGHASVEVFYGRAVTPWWDALAGLRHEFGHGPSRTYAALGVQGMAPYKIEVDATVFAGVAGRGGVALAAEYDTLLTNRLVLQWQAEADVRFRDDPAVGLGSGLSTVSVGARLRYEVTRRFAPYVGVQWERAYGRTADLRRAEGDRMDDARLVAGLRFWF